MRLKKSFVLLLILLISVPLLAGLAHSASTPTIYVNVSDDGIIVDGYGWTHNLQVFICYDTPDASHMVATAPVDNTGYFHVTFPKPTTSFVGTHTIFAIQGLRQATAMYNVQTTLPPDDRLLNPLNIINNYLQSNVGSKLTSMDSKLDSIEEKIDNSKATQILYYDVASGQINPGSGYARRYTADKPVLFTVSVHVNNLDGTESLDILNGYFTIERFEASGSSFETGTITFASTKFSLVYDASNGFDWTMQVMVQGMPGTIITVEE
jgi:hypothetical protein